MSGEIRDESPGPGRKKCVTFSTYLWAGLGFRVLAPSCPRAPEFGNTKTQRNSDETWCPIPRAFLKLILDPLPLEARRPGDLEAWRTWGLEDLRI